MTATIHDSGYKRLFSNKTIFRQLIQTFVEEEWVPQLDFERAERLDKSFVSEHYKETEADIIYKVPLLESDTVIYLCLLIEFQSSVQRFMILRTLQYKCDFYMDFVLSNKHVRGLLLPAMFPLVLYNGEDRWTAPANIDQLIETEIDLGAYGLHFQHLVIAENSYGKEWLAKIDNIIAALFLAEAHYDLPLLLEKLLSLYDTEPDRQALQIFINWFRQLSAHGRLPQSDFAQIEEQDLTREEVKSMLIKALEREREIIRQEGIDIGVKKGIEERNRQIARAMIANGFALPTIAHLLNLPPAEVETLLAEPATGADEASTQEAIA
jgi:predicted transposase/invertase (TIGR01784 family)